jgi:transcriptional regulator with XRE-family HTH domain
MKPDIKPRKWLTELREAQRPIMSMSKLAEKAGVSDVYIRYIESGARTPTPAVAIRIGESLGLSEEQALMKFFSKKQTER